MARLNDETTISIRRTSARRDDGEVGGGIEVGDRALGGRMGRAGQNSNYINERKR
jgi:hypothetical protein